MMGKIELFPHNERGYEKLVDSLENSNFSFLERATGTGKSYILIKYMAEHFANKRVLFVTLHDSMFKQLTERDMEVLGTSKDIYKKLDCVLYSSIGKHSAEWYYENYDCIIFDEAHHCGAPQWGQTIGELRDLIKNSEDKKMIGATATSIRYLDNYLDVAKEFFEDNVASRLSIAEAILSEILPAPYYINNNDAAIQLLIKINAKLRKLENYKELDQIRKTVSLYRNQIQEKMNPNKLLKKYNVSAGEKYIIFCESIDELKRKQEDVDNWFKDIAPLEKYEAHSLQPNKINQSQIDLFENNNNPNTIKIMFAVDMFNEGLHIKGVDGIFMTRRTTSPIVYLQQLGRALSFSSRKKQIKIFDLVGNATQIDIIYNLYKELISTAKEELKNSKEKEDHYKEILNRFKIVDEGNELIDELEAINKFLDENYLNREKIKRNILILKNYIANVKEDFMTLLNNKQIDRQHLKIYNELRTLADSLSFEDYIELNKLGIIISDYQQSQKTLEKIRVNGNFKNVVDAEIKDVIYRYNCFYKDNNRRPTLEDDEELVFKYRKHLNTMKRKDALKYLKDVDYPLNIEELLILKDYPSSETIQSYIEIIENKYKNGIIIDALEKRTIESISKIVSLKEKAIILTLFSNQVIKIDESIKVLKKYLLENPDENFENINKFLEFPEIVRSIKTINNYAIYVTNKQFEVLLEMGIKLPKVIDMTLEQRKNILGNYESIYEKEENLKRITATAINAFIIKQGRRPNINYVGEYELALKYDKIFYDKNSIWTKKVIQTLLEQKIPLTLDEKVIGDFELNKEELDVLYKSVMEEFNNCSIENFNVKLIRKKLNALKKYNYIDNKLYNILNRTSNVVEYIFTNIDNSERDIIKAYLFNNQALVPFSLISYIFINFGMSLVKVNSALKNNDNLVNMAHQKYVDEIKCVNEYINYINERGKRPKENSLLNTHLRKYLAKATLNDINNYCNRLNELKIPLILEELFLLKLNTLDEEKELYKKIIDKKKISSKLDELDTYIYNILNLKFSYGYENEETNKSNLISEANKEMQEDIIKSIKEQIKNNPSEEIEFTNIYLSENEKEELNTYRIVCLSKNFITNLIENMQKLGKSYQEILNEDDLQLLELMIKTCKSYNENLELIDKLIKLNKEIILKNNDINIEKFIIEYLEYIQKNNKEPNIDSEDMNESTIAKKYKILNELLSYEEKKLFFSSIRKSVEQLQKNDFYYNFVSFIELNQRFPSILGDTLDEINLAKEYQKIGSKLPIEQKQHINTLMKKYQMNTILYIEKKKGK